MTAGKATGTALEKPRCGAQTRKGGTCRVMAGGFTTHPGAGRCKYHEGGNRTHGRYSRVLTVPVAAFFEQMSADPKPLDATPELALARAHLAALLAEPDLEPLADDAETLVAIQTEKRLRAEVIQATLEQITRMVERIEKAKNLNGITRANFSRVLHAIWAAIDLRVSDERIKAALRDDLISIKVE